MAKGGFPNKNRAINAYDAYGDAMRPYVARVLKEAHGPDWIRLRLLSDDFRKDNRRRYDEIKRALQSKRAKRSPISIVDRADIPNLVDGDRENFPDLNRDAIRRLFTIRDLRNTIVHSGHPGDCTIEEANAIISLCVLALERCGLSNAAESIRDLSLEVGPREQHARREWDKGRLAGKSPKSLTPWEQQRLAEIEWEEEWERRELVRREQAELTALSNDIHKLRRWFNADKSRYNRHQSKYSKLLQQEKELLQQKERQRKQREFERKERNKERYKKRKERAELTALRGSANDLRRWFDTDKIRRKRHPTEYGTLKRLERLERERDVIAAFGDNIDGLRQWFDAGKKRPREHPSEHAALEQREQKRREQKRHERERHKTRERQRIAAFGDNIDGLRRWFDAHKVRQELHPAEYAALEQREQEQREQERRESATFGNVIDGLHRWFGADKRRRQRQQLEYAALERRDQDQWEREYDEIAAFGGDIDGLRRWFDTNKVRRERHQSDYTALERQERERERAEILALGDDIDKLRLWFNTDEARNNRHPSEYAALLQRERERAEVIREERQRKRAARKQERAEIAALIHDIDGLRLWFNADEARNFRHPSEYAALRRQKREQTERRKRQESERLEQEQTEIAGFGDDWPELRRWFAADRGRRKRHAARFAQLKEEERRQWPLEQERRARGRLERDWIERESIEIAAFGDDIDGLRRWFNEDLTRARRHKSTWLILREKERSRERQRRS